jgi:hypothetical protein
MRSEKLNLDPQADAIDAAEARMRLALGLGSRPAHQGAGHGNPVSHAPASSAPPAHEGTRPRRRFAQDGDVQVVKLSRGRENDGGENRLGTLTAKLQEEKDARTRLERALDEANLSIQSLKTKLAHTEMAFDEKLKAEQAARALAESQRAIETEARSRAEARQAEAELALAMAESKLAALVQSRAASAKAPEPVIDLFGDAAPAKARRGRPPAAKAAPAALVEKPARAPKAEKAAPVAEVEDAEEQPIEWWLPSFRAQKHAVGARKRKAR